MKKYLSFLMILLLFLKSFSFSFAENTKAIDNNIDFIAVNDDFHILDSLMIENTLYYLTPESLFAYDIETLTARPLITNFLSNNTESFFANSLFYWKDNFYGLDLYTGKAYLFDLIKGVVEPNPIFSFSWEEFEKNFDLSYELLPQGVFGDELFILFTYTSANGKANQTFLYSYRLPDGYQTHYQTPSLQGLFAKENGGILAYREQVDSTYEVGIFDPVTDNFIAWKQFKSDFYFYAPAYHAPSETLFFIENSQLVSSAKGEDNQFLAQLPQRGGRKGFISSKGNYYIMPTMYNGIYIYSTKPKETASLLLPKETYLDEGPISVFLDNYPFFSIKRLPKADASLEAQLLTQTVPTDILSEDLLKISFGLIKDKSFAYPLSESELIQEKFSLLYPYLKEALCYNGIIYGIPYYIHLSVLSYDPVVLRELGLSEKDVPTNYIEYLQFVLQWQKDERLQSSGYYLSSTLYDRLNLFYSLIQSYVSSSFATQEKPLFNSSDFREMMLLAQKVDFTDSTLCPPINSSFDTPVLFQEYFFSSDQDHLRPLFFHNQHNSFLIDYSRSEIQILFINPYTQNLEAALAFLESILENMPVSQLPFFYTSHNKPVENKDYINSSDYQKQILLLLEEQLKSAEKKDKPQIQEAIIETKKQIDLAEKYQWLVSAKTIENYSTLVSNLILPMEMRGFYSGSEESLYTLMNHYINGALTLDEFIIEADRKMDIYYLEIN